MVQIFIFIPSFLLYNNKILSMIVTNRNNSMSDLIKNYISGNIILSMIVIDKLQFLYRIL